MSTLRKELLGAAKPGALHLAEKVMVHEKAQGILILFVVEEGTKQRAYSLHLDEKDTESVYQKIKHTREIK